MSKKQKQTRPLFIPKPENGDFPFNINDVSTDLKQLDFYRMYNALKLVIENLIEDQAAQQKLLSNIDAVFRVFIEKDLNPPQPQKLVGRRSSPYTYQKQEFWQLVEHLNGLGFSYRQLSERLQVHYVQISTHHRHQVILDEDSEYESSQAKKKDKEKERIREIVNRQQPDHEVFFSDDEKK